MQRIFLFGPVIPAQAGTQAYRQFSWISAYAGITLIVMTMIVSQSIYANPLEERFGLGARTKAMGGVGITQAEDFSATYYNPGNLPYCTKNLISVGYQNLRTKLSASNADGVLPSEQVGSNHIGHVGACLKLPINIALGLYASFGVEEPVSLQFRTVDNKIRFALYDNSLSAPSTGLGIGYRPIKWISFGVATSITVHTDFQQRILVPLPPSNEELEIDMTGMVRPTLTFVGGITSEPIEGLRISAVYRSPRYNKLEDVAITRSSAGGLVFDVKQNMEGVFGFSPMQVGGGVSYSFLKKLTLATDLTWYRWSQYSGPFLRISPADNSELSRVIIYPPDEDYEYINIFVPRAGLEYVWRDVLSARAGYGYRFSPAPQPAGKAQLVDGGVHMVAFGGGYKIVLEKVTFDADVFFTLHVMPETSFANYSFGGLAYDTGLALTIGY